ncbi:HdeD family acid-resistance protein [Cellulosimicrobium arenosum]|uniref:DUF308 domain-containing protein n=1 Tax=Cellulosimicrobium arenosum TaxID=2708133 RepID=A0A927J0G9_9MICO|nr:DUF308 domain-containing protein [Cellulosimicrobium arenosum]MBD8079634.1 DUF308 domain-containing protein [Cellulosimicrobium arenosum]
MARRSKDEDQGKAGREVADGTGTDATAEQKVEVRNPFRRVWWLPVVRGVLLVVLGLLLMIEPLEQLEVLRLVLGAFLVADGVLVAVQWFAHRRQTSSAWWLAQAAVNIVFGVVVAFWPDLNPTALYYVLSVWVLVLGIVAIAGAAGLTRNRDLGAAWMLAFGITSTLFGLLLLTRPLDSLDVLRLVVIVFALYAFVAGAIHVVSGFAVRAIARELGDLRGQAEAAGVVVTGGSVLGSAAARPDVAEAGAARAPGPAAAPVPATWHATEPDAAPEPALAPGTVSDPASAPDTTSDPALAPDTAPEPARSADTPPRTDAGAWPGEAADEAPGSGARPGSTGAPPAR